jgi:hypothetical protein
LELVLFELVGDAVAVGSQKEVNKNPGQDAADWPGPLPQQGASSSRIETKLIA